MSLIEKRIEITSEYFKEFREQNWKKLLQACKVKILKQFSNEFIDAYLLSESSLFVFEEKIILITCGGGNPLQLLDQEPFRNQKIQYHYEERSLEKIQETPCLKIISVKESECKRIFSGTEQEQRNQIHSFLQLKNKRPDFKFQDHFFDPQGYSLNGLQQKDYWSVHWSFEEDRNLLSIESSIEALAQFSF